MRITLLPESLSFEAFEVDATADVVAAATAEVSDADEVVGVADATADVAGVAAADVVGVAAADVVGVAAADVADADEVVGVKFVSVPLGFLNKLAQLS